MSFFLPSPTRIEEFPSKTFETIEGHVYSHHISSLLLFNSRGGCAEEREETEEFVSRSEQAAAADTRRVDRAQSNGNSGRRWDVLEILCEVVRI